MKGRKKREDRRKNKDVKEEVASKIFQLILKMQSCFATAMTKITKGMSATSMKWSLGIFLLAGMSLSIYCVTEAFSKKNQVQVIKIDKIQTPRYYNQDDDTLMQPNIWISKEEYEELQTFQRYMDSLHHNKSGQHIYDSIMLYRPGLSDSINQLEKLYQQQLQNKK